MNTMTFNTTAYSFQNNVPMLPKRIEIELSSACNLHCVYCPRHFLKNISSFIDYNLFKRIIDELEPYPETILVLHRRGESLLHPKFSECLDYVKGKFCNIQLATNGTLLDKEISKKIIESISFISFSLDVPEEFNRMRTPADYEAVEAKIHQFITLNEGRITTQISMVRTSETPTVNMERFKQIWSGKVDRIRIYEEHSADGSFGSLKNKRSERVPCAMPFYEILIFADGRVGRCNHDWNGDPLGCLKDTTIRELWNSKKYEYLREQHRILKLTDPVCRSCDSWYPIYGRQMTGETYEFNT